MAKKPSNEQTGKKAASAASRVLRNPNSSRDAKSAAASALTQAPNKSRGPKGSPAGTKSKK